VQQVLTQDGAASGTDASHIAEVLMGMSFPANSSSSGGGSSSSSRDSTDSSSKFTKKESGSSSSSNSLWDYVKQLGRFATPAAQGGWDHQAACPTDPLLL
jgi:hypothetical protein